MHLNTRTWFLISLACFILAGYFWHLGNERYRRQEAIRATNAEPAIPIKELGADNLGMLHLRFFRRLLRRIMRRTPVRRYECYERHSH